MNTEDEPQWVYVRKNKEEDSTATQANEDDWEII